ncbi:MAG: hypothetical protein QOJ87_142 [Verrucomicrobiota bacterium]|jgi:hypothetical protein
MNVRVVLIILAALMLESCSDTPSPSDARQKLANQIQQQSNGLIKLVSFEKTDGVMQEMMGIKAYQMSYTAEVEFLDDCIWTAGNNLVGWDGSFRAQRNQALSSGALNDFFNASQGLKPAKKGEHFTFTGQMAFEKTERGWH